MLLLARKRSKLIPPAMNRYRLYRCIQCGFEYDEALGWPEDGILPGTRWDDIPDDWKCPDCGVAKADFVMVEVIRAQ